MKQFLKGVIEWKTAVCFSFTAAVFIYLLFSLVFGNREVSTALLWTLLLASMASSLIQALCFSDWIIKKMRYTRRSILFVLLFLPTLTLAAWKGQWFPMEYAGSWAIFLGMFFLTFIGTTIGFDIYFRITGKKYDGLLGQYRKQRDESEK